MGKAVPPTANVTEPLKDLLGTCLEDTKRTKQAASPREILESKWTPVKLNAWDVVRELASQYVQLHQRKEEERLLISLMPTTCFGGVV